MYRMRTPSLVVAVRRFQRQRLHLRGDLIPERHRRLSGRNLQRDAAANPKAIPTLELPHHVTESGRSRSIAIALPVLRHRPRPHDRRTPPPRKCGTPASWHRGKPVSTHRQGLLHSADSAQRVVETPLPCERERQQAYAIHRQLDRAGLPSVLHGRCHLQLLGRDDGDHLVIRPTSHRGMDALELATGPTRRCG